MTKNITFTADEQLISKAREKAKRDRKSLNVAFREWLSQYVENDRLSADYTKLMMRLKYVKPGKKFTRDELNER